MKATLWGTRGSLASAGPDTVRYGGDTLQLAPPFGTSRGELDALVNAIGEALHEVEVARRRLVDDLSRQRVILQS